MGSKKVYLIVRMYDIGIGSEGAREAITPPIIWLGARLCFAPPPPIFEAYLAKLQEFSFTIVCPLDPHIGIN